MTPDPRPLHERVKFPKWRTPRERVVRSDILCMAFNVDSTVGSGKGVYDLECGHKQVGRLGSERLHCDSCQRIWDLGLDYNGYRNLDLPDPLLDLPDAPHPGNEEGER